MRKILLLGFVILSFVSYANASIEISVMEDQIDWSETGQVSIFSSTAFILNEDAVIEAARVDFNNDNIIEEYYVWDISTDQCDRYFNRANCKEMEFIYNEENPDFSNWIVSSDIFDFVKKPNKFPSRTEVKFTFYAKRPDNSVFSQDIIGYIYHIKTEIREEEKIENVRAVLRAFYNGRVYTENDKIEICSRDKVKVSSLGSYSESLFGFNINWDLSSSDKDKIDEFSYENKEEVEVRFDENTCFIPPCYIVLEISDFSTDVKDVTSIEYEVNEDFCERVIETRPIEEVVEIPEKECVDDNDCNEGEECQIGYGICRLKNIEEWECSESDGFPYLENGEENVLYNNEKIAAVCRASPVKKDECGCLKDGRFSISIDGCEEGYFTHVREYSCEDDCEEGEIKECGDGECIKGDKGGYCIDRTYLLKLLNEIPLFKELNNDPRIIFKIMQDSSLYDEGILAAFVEDIGSYIGDYYRARIRVTPYFMLDEEDKLSFKSTLYHELVHVKQSSEIWGYMMKDVFGSNLYGLPEWKMKFYFAKIPEENKIHIGSELDAHYKQVLFEYEETGEINKATLAGFFTNYMSIQRTSAFKDYEEVRNLVSEQYNKIVEISGYTLESFLEEYYKKDTKKLEESLLQDGIIKKLVEEYGEDRVKVMLGFYIDKGYDRSYIITLFGNYEFELIEEIVLNIEKLKNPNSDTREEGAHNLRVMARDLEGKITLYHPMYNAIEPLIIGLKSFDTTVSIVNSAFTLYLIDSKLENLKDKIFLIEELMELLKDQKTVGSSASAWVLQLIARDLEGPITKTHPMYNVLVTPLLKNLNDYDMRESSATILLPIIFKLEDVDDIGKENIVLILSTVSHISPFTIKEAMLEIPEFLDIYNKVNADFEIERYSITLAVYRFLEKNPEFDVETAINRILEQREKFKTEVILGPDHYFISFVHEDPSMQNEIIKNFARKRSVTNIIREDLKGPEDKDEIENAIINSKNKGETVIWINVHGLSNYVCLGSGVPMEERKENERESCFGFRFDEFADILLKRENLQEVTLIIDSCFSYDFAEQLLNDLSVKNSESYPLIVTETNKGKVGKFSIKQFMSMFMESLNKLDLDDGKPLLGKHIFEAEKYSFEKQDSAVFFSAKREKPIEIAQNYLNHGCVECEGDFCPIDEYFGMA